MSFNMLPSEIMSVFIASIDHFDLVYLGIRMDGAGAHLSSSGQGHLF